tara:strand:- start:2194 stop:2751 length:558 start_codon:yes stop_codon:yes gene_type:complete
MKTFKSFLTESEKTYKFFVRVAGDLPEGFVDKMERNLNKYELLKLSAGKRTPIQEKPMDFPQLQNCEVTHYEVELKYPTTAHILEHYLVNCCDISHSHLTVRGEHDPIERQQSEKTDEPYESILNTEDMGGESAQQDVAGARVMDLLKELETARKEREIDPMEGAPKGESADISDDINTKAVVGG